MVGMVLIFYILIIVIEKKDIIILLFYNIISKVKGINFYLKYYIIFYCFIR